MNLRWTNAGRAALADAANVGTAALRLTHFAIGDMHGPGGAADDGRAALRGERHRAAVTGTAAADDRIAFRADFTPDASYSITEAGVFGTVGDPAGPLTLYLYWTDGGTAAGQAADGTALTVAAVIEFQAAAADVAVTVGGTITFGRPPGEASESEFGLTRYADPGESEDATEDERAVTPQRMHGAAGAVLAALVAGAVGDGTVYQLAGNAAGKLIVVERTQDGATSQAIQSANMAIMTNEAAIQVLQGDTRDATTSRKGIVELATSAEAQTGTDAVRAMTAKATRDAASETVASLKAVAPTAGEKLILEGVAGGGVRVIRSPFDRYYEAAEQSIAGGGLTLISIDSATEWGIPATGNWLVTGLFASHDSGYKGRLGWKRGAGAWNAPPGVGTYAETSETAAVTDPIHLRGGVYCGALEAGDKFRLEGRPRTGFNAPSYPVAVSKRLIALARIS